jgi:hypothetical protein
MGARRGASSRPGYALSDLIFVPAGILAAVLYNTGSMAVFWLFAG